jgi:predicted acyl esterase
MVAPSFKMLKAKKDLNEEQKVELKLTKLLLEQPNIPVTDVQKIKVPTLVIAGDHDVIKVEHSVEIFKQLPQGYLWILPTLIIQHPLYMLKNLIKWSMIFSQHRIVK